MALPIILLDGVVPVAQDFMTLYQYLDDRITAALGAGSSLGGANQFSAVNAAGTAAEYKTVNGTANQIGVAHGAGSLTLALTAVVALATRLQVGTNAADTGGVGLANEMWVTARNILNTANVNLLKLDSSNRVQLGPGDATNLRMGGQVRADLDAATRLVLPVGADRWAV